MISSGNPPANITGESFIPLYADSGMLQEVPAYVLEGLNPSFIMRGRDGKAYAIAYRTALFGLYYNKDLFVKAGLDPEKPPKTWDEWKEVSRRITEAGKGQFWGGGVPTFPNLGGTLRATPFFRQVGTDFYVNNKINLTDPKVQQALQFIREMNAFFPPGVGNNADEGPLWNMFEKDKTLAFGLSGSWEESYAILTGWDIGISPLPLPTGGKAGNCLVGTVYVGIPVGVSREVTDLMWDYFKNQLLSESTMRIMADYGSLVPLNSMINNPSVWEGPGKYSLRIAIEDLKSGTYTGLVSYPKNESQIWEIINQQVLARVTMTDDPIDRICSEAQAKIEALLR
jgi:ABC-type glycerol-3-phosphate transport system substrate-binding protein